jgi:hypothetical protein
VKYTLSGSKRKSKGELIAKALSGAWRSNPPALDISEPELQEILPLLLKSGAAALCWRRVRGSELQGTDAAGELQQAYRLQTLQTRIDERKIEQSIKFLRSVEIEPILVKGWAIARFYPERGARPYGDIDLCVRPEQYNAARMALTTREGRQYNVDLHNGLANLGGGSEDEHYARSHLVKLGDTDVRVPGSEDHLRVLSFHMLREGAWRPLWLCDVAAALEARPANFNWEHCFGGTRRNKELVCCAIALAHQLLEAQVDDISFAADVDHLPSWVVPTVAKEWESLSPSMTRRHFAPAATYLRRPFSVRTALGDRWPNPVEASVVARAPFNEFPRIPFQVGAYLIRASGFLWRLPSIWRTRRSVVTKRVSSGWRY